MRVFLDDLRKTPPGWQRVCTAWEAIAVCQEGRVSDLSLDYDLDAVPCPSGGYCDNTHPGTGGDVSKWLLKQAQMGNWGWVPAHIRIHSSNHDGVGEMAWDLAELERLRFAKALGVPPEEMW